VTTTEDNSQPPIERLAGFIEEVAPHFDSYLYRGVTNSGHTLVPSLARHLGGRSPSKEELKGLETREIGALRQFWMRSQVYGGPRRPLDVEFMALAAHFGLRTRLLDWTHNPLVALYFAVSDSGDQLRKDGAVYVLAPGDGFERIDPLAPLPISHTTVLGLIPHHIDARMTAQDTVLTVHPSPWSALTSGDIGEIRTLIVPKDKKAVLRRELQACGIHEQTLFPGHEGLARSVNFEFFRG
jgi:hypothetical protein